MPARVVSNQSVKITKGRQLEIQYDEEWFKSNRYYEGCSLILVSCLITIPVLNVICGESPIFSDQIGIKLLLSDAQSYSNCILRQGTAMTLRRF